MPSSPRTNRKEALAKKMTGFDDNFLGRGTVRKTADVIGKGLELGRKAAGEIYSKSRTGNPMEVAGKYGQQFASSAAKKVIKDAQGVAKMVVKGFGN